MYPKLNSPLPTKRMNTFEKTLQTPARDEAYDMEE